MKMFLVLVLCFISAYAYDDEGSLQSAPLMEEVDPNLYVIGPGDVLWFSSQGGVPGDSTSGSAPKLLEVTPDGYAVLPSVGAWKVSGMNLSEAAFVIERGFATRFPGMSGIAGLARMRTFQVPVTGHVNNPGIAEVTGAMGLVSVLEEVGGIASSGSMTGIMVIGNDGDTAVVDITSFLLNGDMSSNPYLSLGDRVHVPQALDYVWLEGAINFDLPMALGFREAADSPVWSRSRRGMVEFIPGERVSDLISRVGGTDSWAIRDSCYVSRQSETYGAVRIPAPLDDPQADPLLQPGDVVVCPGVPPVVTVVGEVVEPGVYPHTAGMGPEFYVSQAGGYLRESRRSGTSVILANGEELDADRVRDVPAGSSVSVPRKALVGWEDPLLIFTSIASIVIAWKSISE